MEFTDEQYNYYEVEREHGAFAGVAMGRVQARFNLGPRDLNPLETEYQAVLKARSERRDVFLLGWLVGIAIGVSILGVLFG